jgi:hypothetical protein
VRGFSLIEILVSSLIITLSVIALVTVIRKGSELVITESHRKRARSVIDSCFESPSYHYSNYWGLANVNRSVLIDPRDAGIDGDDLMGSLAIKVAVDTVKAGGTNVPAKKVIISVSWKEPEGLQSIILEKHITKI